MGKHLLFQFRRCHFAGRLRDSRRGLHIGIANDMIPEVNVAGGDVIFTYCTVSTKLSANNVSAAAS